MRYLQHYYNLLSLFTIESFNLIKVTIWRDKYAGENQSKESFVYYFVNKLAEPLLPCSHRLTVRANFLLTDSQSKNNKIETISLIPCP